MGNTAYITFDRYTAHSAGAYYVDDIDDIPMDTIGLIALSHRMIYRKDSPIENVVIDMSMNEGGDVNAALFVLGWVLGDANLTLKNTFTGAQTNAYYRADVNLDREFNSGDEVDDKNIFCLISPLSFSCGNLVSTGFKASQRVTLLGRTSGGGACIVQSISTAWGTCFQISSPYQLSVIKNGSLYDIDQGVDPDFVILRPEDYYDREALTEYINGLF